MRWSVPAELQVTIQRIYLAQLAGYLPSSETESAIGGETLGQCTIKTQINMGNNNNMLFFNGLSAKIISHMRILRQECRNMEGLATYIDDINCLPL